MKKLLTLVNMKLCFISLFTFTFLLFTHLSTAQGHWSKVKALAPHFNYGVCLLMTDGTVICHNQTGGSYGKGWDRLTPDIHGSYANGTWDSIAYNTNDRLYFSSQVLPSGKVYVAGGEYGAGTNQGEVYDPATNTWTPCGPVPNGWDIFDGNSELLFNGNVLEGPQIADSATQNCLTWNPGTLNYTLAATALYGHDEAQWLKLRDSTIITVGINTQTSNRYFPKNNTWVNDGTVPVNLWDGLEEAGPGLNLPNGNCILFGATPANAIYRPSNNNTPGTFIAADSFPVIQGTRVGQSDAPAAMMVNGKILCSVAPSTSSFSPPTWFVEYDYTTNTFKQITDTIPGMGGHDSIPVPSYETQMLDLPDGTVLVSVSQAHQYSETYLIYTPSGSPIPQGKPTINSVRKISCNYYSITGKLFNGISEGAAYGDDWQMATNYPLVRLTNGTNVYYATTSNWNRKGALQTDSLEDSANFKLPSMPGGTYSLVVVANGFASNPVLFTTFGASISSVTNSACNGGRATVTATDGVNPYTYSWSPNGGTKATASNLSAGNYTVTVTDASGCSATLGVTITAPTPLTLSCNSQTLVFNYTGSLQAWRVPPGVNSVTLDVRGAEGGSTGGLGGRVQCTYPATPGTVFNIYVGGQGGAEASAAAGGWNGGGNAGTCSGYYLGSGGGGESDIRVGGTSFANWIVVAGGGGGIQQINGNPGAGGGLLGGNAGSTGNGCIATYATGGTQIAGGANCTSTGTCCTFTASAGGSQGQGADGDGPSLSCNSGDGGGGGGGGYWGGGSGGGYSSGGGGSSWTSLVCTNVTHTQGYNAGNGAILISYAQPGFIITPSCFNASTGTAAFTCLNGGVPPYTYLWNPGGQTNFTATGLSAGTYTITVSDSCGNSVTASTTVIQTNFVSVAGDSVHNLLCHGYSNGTATVLVNPGTPPYSYHWSPIGGSNATGTGLSIGTYTVTVSDSCGNSTTTTVTLTQPAAITAITDSINVTDTCNGAALVIPSGGVPPYTYLWALNGQTTDSIKDQCVGKYCCVVTDNNGCVFPVCITINLGEGINQVKGESEKVKVYPNPSNGNYEFQITNYEGGTANMEVYNVLGEEIYSQKPVIRNSQFVIDLRSKSDGIYFYRVITDNGNVLGEGKLIIQK